MLQACLSNDLFINIFNVLGVQEERHMKFDSWQNNASDSEQMSIKNQYFL